MHKTKKCHLKMTSRIRSAISSVALWQSFEAGERLKKPCGNPFSTFSDTFQNENIIIDYFSINQYTQNRSTCTPASKSLFEKATVSSRQGSILVVINVVGGYDLSMSSEAKSGDKSGSS